MEALSGSCLLIPCAFTHKSTPEQEFNNTVESFGVWIKNETKVLRGNVVFNSSRTVNAYPLSLIGDLGEKNCTTLFSSLIVNYTDRYFFRIENWPFRATAYCQPLQITVKGKNCFYHIYFLSQCVTCLTPNDLCFHLHVRLTHKVKLVVLMSIFGRWLLVNNMRSSVQPHSA